VLPLPLQALVLEAEEKLEAQSGGERSSLAAAATTFYEVTIASIDQPKLLSRLSESLVRGLAGAAWDRAAAPPQLASQPTLYCLPTVLHASAMD
jgi:hypothetical protein